MKRVYTRWHNAVADYFIMTLRTSYVQLYLFTECFRTGDLINDHKQTYQWIKAAIASSYQSDQDEHARALPEYHSLVIAIGCLLPLRSLSFQSLDPRMPLTRRVSARGTRRIPRVS